MNKNILELKQVEFELNPTYEGRRKILKEMREGGLEEEADELQTSVCSDCLGCGEVNNYTFDTDSKEWLWDGMKMCHCQAGNF